MSFLSDNDIDERLKSPDNLVNRLEIHRAVKGKVEGSVDIPIEIKKTIAILANTDEKGQDIARAFDVSDASVSNYKNGMINQGRAPEIMRVIQRNRDAAETIAIDNLLTSLQLLPDRLSKTKNAKTLSTVAKDMATIANQMSGKDGGDSNKNIHLHLYAPPQAKVEDYEVIDV